MLSHRLSKIAGVSKGNRQDVVRYCASGDILTLRAEPDNQYDKNAIMIERNNGDQLGYVNAEIAEEIAEEMRMGMRHAAIVISVTGGTVNKPNLGCNIILLSVLGRPLPGEEQNYINQILKKEGVNAVVREPATGHSSETVVKVVFIACTVFFVYAYAPSLFSSQSPARAPAVIRQTPVVAPKKGIVEGVTIINLKSGLDIRAVKYNDMDDSFINVTDERGESFTVKKTDIVGMKHPNK